MLSSSVSSSPAFQPPEKGTQRALPRPDRWARGLRVPLHDAEDIVQDALVALLEEQGSPPESRLDWLWQTARLRKLRLFRARARAAAYQPRIEAHLRELSAPGREPDGEMERRERLLSVLWILDQVKPARREVARRHLLHEESLEEIAASLDLAIGTVKSRWERAKDDMRAAVERERAKDGNLFKVSAVAALLSAIWLWIRGCVRRKPGALLASAVVALAVTSHGAMDIPYAAASASSERGKAHSLAALPPAPPVPASADSSAPGAPPSMPVATAPLASVPVTTAPLNATAAQDAWKEKKRRMARNLLGRATIALAHADRAAARDAIRAYDLGFPENPFAEERTQIAISLSMP